MQDIREAKSIAEHSVDGRLVRKDRLIDRGNNRYKEAYVEPVIENGGYRFSVKREKVTVVDTGDVIRHADHKLTDHTGHGSDKPAQGQE